MDPDNPPLMHRYSEGELSVKPDFKIRNVRHKAVHCSQCSTFLYAYPEEARSLYDAMSTATLDTNREAYFIYCPQCHVSVGPF